MTQRTAAAVCLALTLVGCATNTQDPVAAQPQSRTEALTASSAGYAVKYVAYNKNVTSQFLHGELQVTNNNARSALLSDLSILYYFTREGTGQPVGVANWAAVQGPIYRDVTPTVSFAFDAEKLTIKFGSTAGVLQTGETVVVQYQVHNSDWSNYDQSNDASFNPGFNVPTLVTTIPVIDGAATPVAPLTGQVKSPSGAPIGGASIKVGSSVVALSDAAGRFALATELTGSVVITISASGYSDLSRRYQPFDGRLTIVATLLPFDVVTVIDPAIANTVTTPDGASVAFPAMTGFTERLIVSLNSINAANGDLASAPGDFSARDGQGKSVVVVSQGMLDVVIKGEDTGRVYDLAGKGPFTINVPASRLAQATPTQPLWYYDASAGLWREQGAATLVGGIYTGTVTHFTTWNVDETKCMNDTTCACIHGWFDDPSNPGHNPMDYEVMIETAGLVRTLVRTMTPGTAEPDLAILNVPNGDYALTVKNLLTDWTGRLVRNVPLPTYTTPPCPPEGCWFPPVPVPSSCTEFKTVTLSQHLTGRNESLAIGTSPDVILEEVTEQSTNFCKLIYGASSEAFRVSVTSVVDLNATLLHVEFDYTCIIP